MLIAATVQSLIPLMLAQNESLKVFTETQNQTIQNISDSLKSLTQTLAGGTEPYVDYRGYLPEGNEGERIGETNELDAIIELKVMRI